MKLTPISYNPFDNPARRVARAEGGMTLQRTAPFPEAPEGYEFYSPSDEPAGDSGVAPQNDILAQEGVSPGVTAGVGKMIQGVGDWIATPGNLMSGAEQVQPEIPGQWSEEDQYRQNLANAARSQKEIEFGGQAMFNLYGTSAPFIPKGTLGIAGGRPPFAEVRKSVGSDPNYVYHATNVERAEDIANEGLKTHKPHEFTDQDVWPDMSTEKRNYFTPTAENTWQFAPEEGSPVLLRIKKTAHDFKRESTGDLYSTKPVPASKIEYLSKDGQWLPLAELNPVAKPFYSAVERAIAEAPQAKASPEQWAAMLRNKPGIKEEELDWTGLTDWLKEQKGLVTKQQVLDHVRENQVQVQEVMKGSPINTNSKYALPEVIDVSRQAAGTADDFATTLANDGRAYQALMKKFPELIENEDWAHIVAEDVFGSPTSATKFSSYTLPGGENYKELLLTLPSKASNKLDPSILAEMSPQGRGNLTGDFHSSHYDEPNILAHVRFNDRTIDGKKTLFVEEVQSDWHQKGKREGYATRREGKVVPQDGGLYKIEWSDGNFSGGYPTRRMAENAMEDRAQTGVPDAPFKTTWPELAMKRIIRYAAENGYDKVAWTPGEVQAARYDLSQTISRLSLSKFPDGKMYLQAFDKEPKEVIARHVTEEDLPDLIGKEAADKLLNKEPTKPNLIPTVKPEELKVIEGELDRTFTAPNGRQVRVGKGAFANEDEARASAARYLNDEAKKINDVRLVGHQSRRELSGLDLKVGGEGMKGFYDKILPATVNKLVKKHGAKVGEGKIDLPPREDFTERQGNGRPAIKFEKQSVHTLDITPSLRKSAMEQGFPQFAKGGAVKVTKASVNYSKGMPKSHCGICTFYRNHICTKVQGSIDPAYWCELWKKKEFASGGRVKLTAVEFDPWDSHSAVRRACNATRYNGY